MKERILFRDSNLRDLPREKRLICQKNYDISPEKPVLSLCYPLKSRGLELHIYVVPNLLLYSLSVDDTPNHKPKPNRGGNPKSEVE